MLICCVGQVLMILEGHSDYVCDVAISTDGGKIVSCSYDNTVRVWSAETGQVLACRCAVSRVWNAMQYSDGIHISSDR